MLFCASRSPNTMSHLRSIKEMLSIQTGGRNVTTSGYSSYTDSQAFFGSQFWPKHSQCPTQDVSSRASQQSSEETEQRLSNPYHTRPPLFGESKERGNPRGLLEAFEEDKRRARDHSDSEATTKQWKNILQTMNNIHELASSTDRITSVCQSVLEKLDISVSTLQNSFSILNRSVKENITALERKSEKATADLSSSLERFNDKLEDLREDQRREHRLLEQALKQLSTSAPKSVTDAAIQTSPDQGRPVSHVRRHSKREATKLQRVSSSRGQSRSKVGPKDRRPTGKKAKDPPRSHTNTRKPLLLSHRNKNAVPDENCRPRENYSKQQKMIASQNRINVDSVSSRRVDRQTRDKTKARTCLISPFTWWSQDSSGPRCVQKLEPFLEKLSAGSRSGTPVSPGGTWQWFDMNSDSDF